jgi:hypothetical protein
MPGGMKGGSSKSNDTAQAKSAKDNRDSGKSSKDASAGGKSGRMGPNSSTQAKTSTTSSYGSTKSSRETVGAAKAAQVAKESRTTSVYNKGVTQSAADLKAQGYGQYRQGTTQPKQLDLKAGKTAGVVSQPKNTTEIKKGVTASPADYAAQGYGKYQQPPSPSKVAATPARNTTVFNKGITAPSYVDQVMARMPGAMNNVSPLGDQPGTYNPQQLARAALGEQNPMSPRTGVKMDLAAGDPTAGTLALNDLSGIAPNVPKFADRVPRTTQFAGIQTPQARVATDPAIGGYNQAALGIRGIEPIGGFPGARTQMAQRSVSPVSDDVEDLTQQAYNRAYDIPTALEPTRTLAAPSQPYRVATQPQVAVNTPGQNPLYGATPQRQAVPYDIPDKIASGFKKYADPITKFMNGIFGEPTGPGYQGRMLASGTGGSANGGGGSSSGRDPRTGNTVNLNDLMAQLGSAQQGPNDQLSLILKTFA